MNEHVRQKLIDSVHSTFDSFLTITNTEQDAETGGKNTLETGGEDVKLHSKRVEKIR